MLPATEIEIEEVSAYFKSQAPDLEITFLQKVYSEAVIGHRHDVWDVHTNVDRWWVITNPTNLYSQEHFPNMDLAVTFHLGLCLRIPRTQKQRQSDRKVRPFGEVFLKLSEVADALGQAQNVADYQAVGMRSREVLLAFSGVAQDAADWGPEVPPKRADFRAWADVICNSALPGSPQKERRHLIKSLLVEAWVFSNWLTHAQSATWHDAEAAISTVEHALGLAASLVIRHTRHVPDQCPDCGSPHLVPEQGWREDVPEIEWERPTCPECGWTGTPVPVGERLVEDDAEELITRSGGDDADECIIPTVPLRTLSKPSRGKAGSD